MGDRGVAGEHVREWGPFKWEGGTEDGSARGRTQQAREIRGKRAPRSREDCCCEGVMMEGEKSLSVLSDSYRGMTHIGTEKSVSLK